MNLPGGMTSKLDMYADDIILFLELGDKYLKPRHKLGIHDYDQAQLTIKHLHNNIHLYGFNGR